MRKIIAILRPFEPVQQIFVLKDGERIDTAIATIDNAVETIFELSQKWNINIIDLTGVKQFNLKYARDLEKLEMLRYNEHRLEINLI